MLRDRFSDANDDETEEEEATTVATSGSEETTANWRKRGFKRKRIKRPRSSSTGTSTPGGTTNGHSGKRAFVASLLFIHCGTQSAGFPQRTELSNFFGISLLAAVPHSRNIPMLQGLLKLPPTCPASSMMRTKGTLLRTYSLVTKKRTMWTTLDQKTSSSPSVLLQGPRIL